MTVTNQNAALYRGDSETLAVSITDVNGDAFRFVGTGNIKYRVAYTPDDSGDEALVRKELNDGILLLDGVAEITLTADDTDLVPGAYYHELKVYDGSDVATAMTGTLVVRRALSPMTDLEEGMAEIGGTTDLSVDATVA